MRICPSFTSSYRPDIYRPDIYKFLGYYLFASSVDDCKTIRKEQKEAFFWTSDFYDVAGFDRPKAHFFLLDADLDVNCAMPIRGVLAYDPFDPAQAWQDTHEVIPSGTESNPIRLGTPYRFQMLTNIVAAASADGRNVIITNDIDFAAYAVYQPIAGNRAIIDGEGHQIRIDSIAGTHGVLFLDNHGTIKNMTIVTDTLKFSSQGIVEGIAAVAVNSPSGVVENCSVTVSNIIIASGADLSASALAEYTVNMLTIEGDAKLRVAEGTYDFGTLSCEGTLQIDGGSVKFDMPATKRPVNAAGKTLYRVAIGDFAANAPAYFLLETPEGVAYSASGIVADEDGKVYLWLPTGTGYKADSGFGVLTFDVEESDIEFTNIPPEVWKAPCSLAYHGVLQKKSGEPVTNKIVIQFRLYDGDTATARLLWARQTQVACDARGMFGVELSDENGAVIMDAETVYTELKNAIACLGSGDLYIGLTPAPDGQNSAEIKPRQKVRSLPFAIHANNVAGASGDFRAESTAMFKSTAEFAGGLALDGSLAVSNNVVGSGNITVSKQLSVGGDVKLVKGVFEGVGTFPVGSIILWSGSVDNLPEDWVLCNGANGTPDLSGRFVVGYDSSNNDYSAVGKTGGEAAVRLDENTIGKHTHKFQDLSVSKTVTGKAGTTLNKINAIFVRNPNCVYDANRVTDKAGNSVPEPHENRPPFYTLAYIMRIKHPQQK